MSHEQNIGTYQSTHPTTDHITTFDQKIGMILLKMGWVAWGAVNEAGLQYATELFRNFSGIIPYGGMQFCYKKMFC